MKRKLLGVSLLLLACLLILKEQFGLIPISVWTLIWFSLLSFITLFVLAKKRWVLASILSLLLLIRLNDFCHWLAISSWLLFLIGLLIVLGFSLLFKKDLSFRDLVGKSSRKSFGHYDYYMNASQSSQRTIDIIFSDASIYFDETEMLLDLVFCEINAAFSSLTLYVPKEWKVEIKGDQLFSSLDKNMALKSGEKTLVVEADMLCSSLVIETV
ncbi:hypothetical protein ACVRY7_01695 [Streptococcus ictaluri]|uniref:Cell wall-active antibiotics response LiaF-like C-terminal domain-containing protein n=1 Tax=Streptococcus ictaluri 707-05 TaxID=764299 RepID=G5JZK9_9STRE|nr:hypothetical protein [Streptococcus ictaluri]EHI71008.1 hypothetical protein STRIC_0721 [Streptococcus ictaluri 707-05]